MLDLRASRFLYSLGLSVCLCSTIAFAGWWPFAGKAKSCNQFEQLDPDSHLTSFSARRRIGDSVVLTSLSGNFYSGSFAGVSEAAGNQVILLKDSSGKGLSTYYRSRLNLGQTFARGEDVTFVTKLGTPYKGTFAGFDESGDILLRQYEPGKAERELTLKRRDIDGTQTRTGPREVIPIPEAKATRRSQNFGRTPAEAVDVAKATASQTANDSFDDWLSGEGPGADLSFQQQMERMRMLYARATAFAGSSAQGGSDGDYRQKGKDYFNTRGMITRDFVKKWGLKALSDGAVPLPGIPAEMSPRFDGEKYSYPKLSPEMKQTYYRALEAQLKVFSLQVRQLDGLRKSGPGVKASLAKENEAFDTIVNFGRLAASFRQFEDGNWELYGPMLNSMVRRVGFDYNIEHPGYLDLVLQGADPKTLKPWFAKTIRDGGHFYRDDFDPRNPPK